MPARGGLATPAVTASNGMAISLVGAEATEPR